MSFRSGHIRRIVFPQSGGMNFYEGSRRQRGGNLFSAVRRMAIPLIRKAMPSLKATGKDLAKRGVKLGVGVLKDRLTKGNKTSVKESFKQHASKAIDNAVSDYLGDDYEGDDEPVQSGTGLRRARKRKRSVSRSRSTSRKRPCRKRVVSRTKKRRPVKRTRKRRPAKRLKRRQAKTINKSKLRIAKKKVRFADIFD